MLNIYGIVLLDAKQADPKSPKRSMPDYENIYNLLLLFVTNIKLDMLDKKGNVKWRKNAEGGWKEIISTVVRSGVKVV